MRSVAACLLVLALAGAPGCGGDDGEGGGGALERVTLGLDFTPNAAHAGIYAAVREKADERNGLRLTIRPPGGSTPDALKLLEAGRADFGVLDIHDLGLARERGLDIVAIGALVQEPLAAVIARAGVKRPRDLEGKRAGVAGLPSDDAVLKAVVEGDGGDFDKVRRITIGFAAVPSLIEEKVDAVTAFWNAEGVVLRKRGVKTREFRVDDFGAPRYPEVVLIATRETVDERGETVDRFLKAIEAGTEAALADRDATITQIADASGADEPLVRAQLDAVAPGLEPAVELDRQAVEGWAEFAHRFGILEKRPDVAAAFRF